MTLDLQPVSNLPITLDERRLRLILGEGLISAEPRVRTAEEMCDVLLDLKAAKPGELYAMYRDLRFPQDEATIRAHNLRFDVTVIRSGLIGREFIKTAGHYHPLIPGQGLSYPEIYEVIQGGALYFLQKIRTLADPRKVVDLVSIEARPGDRVIIPPDYGHVTINPYKTTLVMTNATADGFDSEYEPYRRLGGGACHLIAEGGRMRWLPNPRYAKLPEIRHIQPREFPGIGLVRGRALYKAMIANPEGFAFLTKPLHHSELFNAALR